MNEPPPWWVRTGVIVAGLVPLFVLLILGAVGQWPVFTLVFVAGTAAVIAVRRRRRS